MCDYKNGKIYKLVCNITGETYIGSTTQSLEERLYRHKSDGLNISGNRDIVSTSKQIIQRNAYYIELLETYPCESKTQLERKEGEYQRDIECINRYIAGRTDKEYYQDNKEELKNKQKNYRKNNLEFKLNYEREYRLKNKEKISKIKANLIVCECGFQSSYGHLARHRRTKKHIDFINKLTSPSNYLSVEEKVV
tara:strand:- start:220 stop:801 length:582 start_codon:yes stop_codon:yes gene_type:complete